MPDSACYQRFLSEVLALGSKEKLLILFDTFGFNVARDLVDTCAEIGANFRAEYVPMIAQMQHSRSGLIPEHLHDCVNWSDVVVFLVSDHEESTRFRANVLQIAKAPGRKVVHLPGLDLELFEEAIGGLNLPALRDDAARLKSMFDSASMVEIQTKDRTETIHTLHLSLEERFAHCDIGQAVRGEISQLPGGEVYLAPNEYLTQGSLVVNGSAPERVFRDGDSVVIHFSKGEVDIDRSSFPSSWECQGFRKELVECKGENPLNLRLGELGVGLNRSILRLTGKPIHDEKAYGTSHVALGNNLTFGGTIGCPYHIDLIFVPQRILLDKVEMEHPWGLSG